MKKLTTLLSWFISNKSLLNTERIKNLLKMQYIRIYTSGSPIGEQATNSRVLNVNLGIT